MDSHKTLFNASFEELKKYVQIYFLKIDHSIMI